MGLLDLGKQNLTEFTINIFLYINAICLVLLFIFKYLLSPKPMQARHPTPGNTIREYGSWVVLAVIRYLRCKKIYLTFVKL